VAPLATPFPSTTLLRSSLVMVEHAAHELLGGHGLREALAGGEPHRRRGGVLRVRLGERRVGGVRRGGPGAVAARVRRRARGAGRDGKSTRLNSSHVKMS